MSKLEYNELEKIAMSLQADNAKLIEELRRMESYLNGVRLEYLFKVLELGDKVFSAQQIQSARILIDKAILTLPKDEKVYSKCKDCECDKGKDIGDMPGKPCEDVEDKVCCSPC